MTKINRWFCRGTNILLWIENEYRAKLMTLIDFQEDTQTLKPHSSDNFFNYIILKTKFYLSYH
jgi:hypothetical protein